MKNSFWKKVLIGGCAYFTVAALLIAVIMLIANSAAVDNVFEIYFSVFRMLTFALFCFAFAFANAFYSFDKMSGWLRLAVHFILTALAFFVCIYLPVSSEMSAAGAELPPQNTVVVLGLFTVVYFIIFGIYKLISGAVKKKKDSVEAYEPVYKNVYKK